MTTVKELLTQTQAELAQANARIVALEAELAQYRQASSRDERIFRHITEYSWNVFLLVNEQGGVKYVSPAITRLTAYSIDEYLQLSVDELIHPDDRALAGTLLQDLLANPGTPRTFEMRSRHKAGHWLWLEITAINYLQNPDLGAILVNSRDITARKLAQLQLQATVEQYRLLADSIPDALFVLGLEEDGAPMQLLEVNERACRLLDYSREELMHLTLAAIDDPASTTPRQQIADRLRAGEQVIFEQTHMTRQGIRIPVEVHATLGTVQGKPVIISLAHDISRRKRVEQELRLFEAAVRQTDDAVVIMDAPVAQNPTILFVNDAFTRITGYSWQEALHQKINILQQPDTDVEKREDLRELHARLARGEIYRGKTRGYQKNGSLLALQWSITPMNNPQGQITHFVAIIRDVTAQEQQVEQLQRVKSALQSYQENLKGVLDTMQDALVSLSLPDRKLICVSASFEPVFGYPIQPFLDDPLFFAKVVHPDDLELSFAATEKVMRDGVIEFEHRLILPDGQVRWLQRRAWLNYDEHGQPIRLNDSARDITARKQAEEALRQNETYLRSLIDSQTAFNIRVNMAGTISYCNKRYQQQFHWMAPTLVGLPALSTVMPDDHEIVRQVSAQCMAQVGTPVLVELRKPTADGGVTWTLWEFIAVADNADAVREIQCVGFDITQQKQTEAALRASEKRYRQMFELHGLPKLIIDPATGQIVDANPAAAHFYGYTVAGLKTLRIFDLSLETSEVIQTKMTEAANASRLSCVFRHRGAEGTPRDVEIFTGAIESEGKQLLYSIITDISERQRAKAALQDAHDLLEARVLERTAELEKVKNRLEAIFEHSGDGILLLDVHYGIQQANHAFSQLFALSDGNHIGRTLTDYFRATQEVDLATLGAEVAATHQTRRVEAQTISVYELPRDVEISIAPINRSAQAVTNLVCIVRDITERKQAAVAISEERNLLRTLIDAVPDFIYVKDLYHRIILNNMAHARSLGVGTPAAALGKNDFELFPAAIAAKFYQDEVQLLQTGEPLLGIEERSLAADGQEIWALTTKVPLRNLKGELIGLVGITHDISKIKATEAALRYHEQQLRASQKMLQLVLDTIPVTVFWKDRNSVYLGCNRLFAENAGVLQTADIIGKRDEDLPWLANQATTFQADDRAVMESGQPKLAYEETLLTAAGKHLVIQTNKLPLRNEENTVIGVLGAYIDITARKEAESSVRASEEKFRQLIESAPIATIITDQSGRIVLVNQAAEKLFGYERQTLLGQTGEFLLPDEYYATRTQYHATNMKALVQQRPSVLELVARRKDGTAFPIDLQLSYIALEPTPLIMAFILDTTQRKQAEAAWKQALAQEKELGELKSRFVSMASHEFRTPLAAILATTETLFHYRAKMAPEQIDSRLDKIRQQVIYMKAIMENVLQLARMQSGRAEFMPTQGDFAALCQEIIEEFESQLLYRGRLVYASTVATLLANFDPHLMRQVINNLILNALKYSGTEKNVHITLVDEATHLTLCISDEGIGIPPNDLKHLFEPFHRATNVSNISGTGLGLSIAKQAIELHQGTITPVSQVGVGTTFTIVLPKSS